MVQHSSSRRRPIAPIVVYHPGPSEYTDVYELDAEDSDNSDPEARSGRIRNVEGGTEDAGWLTWLDERSKGALAHHPKPKLAEPASKRIRVVVIADALQGTPPVSPRMLDK